MAKKPPRINSYTNAIRALDEARAEAGVLRGMAACQNLDMIENPKWAVYLDQQEQFIMGALIAAYPRAITGESMLVNLPARNKDPYDRSIGTFNVRLSSIRGKLGKHVIKTHLGAVPCYSVSPEFMESIKP